jgi:hypothetical protein
MSTCSLGYRAALQLAPRLKQTPSNDRVTMDLRPVGNREIHLFALLHQQDAGNADATACEQQPDSCGVPLDCRLRNLLCRHL